MRGWLVVVLVAACGTDATKLPAPLAALEAAYTRTPELAKTFDPDDLVLSPAGLFVKGGRRAMYMDLSLHLGSALDVAPRRAAHSVVIMPGSPPAALAMIAMEAARHGWRELTIGAFRDGSIATVCRLALPELPLAPVDSELVHLSIYVVTDRVWVGLSRVNEFQEIPNRPTGAVDRTELLTAIKEHKASAFFADREDLEFAADPEIDLATYLGVLTDACTHFHSVRLMAPEWLHARPSL